MFTILFTPEMGESGYVSEVDWTHPHFWYNNRWGITYDFDKEEVTRFLALFKGKFKVFG